MDDFTPRQLRIIGDMVRAGKTLPDDFWAVAAVQTLACLLSEIEGRLAEEEVATLIGIGGYIAQAGKDEAIAGIQARVALMKARPPQ